MKEIGRSMAEYEEQTWKSASEAVLSPACKGCTTHRTDGRRSMRGFIDTACSETGRSAMQRQAPFGSAENFFVL